jgi:hypothetical protein
MTVSTSPAGSDPPDQAGWLHLLLADAPFATLTEHLERLRRTATTDAERQQVDAEGTQALHLKTLLAELRQRAEELSALNLIAGQLPALHDLDDVLQEIVRQAHGLLSVDIAYLGLVSEDRDDEMVLLVTAGELSPRLRGFRFPLATGIAGRVVELGVPQSTSDYLSASEILHNADADAAVSSEHIGTLLGVPLKLRRDVIGVLFVGVRHQRPFSDGQVTLLTSLASHAAIAIANARLFAQSRRAVAEAEAVNRQLLAQGRDVQRAATLHERLTQIVLAGGGVAEVAEGVAEATGGEVMFVGQAATRRGDGRGAAVPAAAAPTTGFRDLDPEALAERFTAPEQRRTVEIQLPDGAAATLSPIASGEDYLGTLVLVTRAAPSESDVRQLERGALATGLVLMTERAVGEAEMRLQDEFLGELLTHPQRDPKLLGRRARQASVDLAAPYCVLVLAAPAGQKSPTRAVATGMARSRGGIVGEHGGYTVVLVPGSAPEALRDELARTVPATAARDATIGVAGPAVGPRALAEAFDDGRRVISVLHALDRTADVACPSDLGIYRFLFSAAGRAEASELVARAVGPLLEHDRARATDLAGTLTAFLANSRRHAATAKELHIHVNTLYQRLDRIVAVLGEQWQEPERALEVQIALRLSRLMHTLDRRAHRQPVTDRDPR